MKKTLQALKILIFVLTSGIIQAQLTDSENYIYTKTNLTADGSRNIESVTYFDGLGRPKQNVIVNGAGIIGKDLVTPIKYDVYGRQALDILPVPVQSKAKGYHSGITDESSANSYYSGKGLGGNAYSESILENSPLDRVMGKYGPGEDWRSNSKKVTYDYLANEDNEVLKFVTTTSWLGGATKSLLALDSNIYYSKSTLYKNKVMDEDDNISYEFKNGQGQTLLVRKMLSLSQSADTYYIYNEYDQLAFVLSPLASEAVKNNLLGIDLSEGGNILSELSYQYRYDGRNRLAEKKLPGKGWEYMVYDQQDRLVLTQDANLRGNKNNFGTSGWLFTKYDKFGRVVYTGFFPNGAKRTNMQTALDSMQQNAGNNEERTSSATVTLQNMPLYYDNKGFPTGNKTLLSVNYYDTYPSGSPGIPGSIRSQPVLTQDSQSSNISTKSLLVASYVKNVEDNNWTKNYNWYDTKARLIGTHSINHLGGYTKTERLLDFAVIPQEVYTYHKRLNSDPETIIKEKFTYDHQNRLIKHTHQVDSNAEELLAENEYDEIGRLVKKKVGNNLQEIDYSYNIRGWLTQINDPNNLGNDLFGYKINYNQVDGLPIPNTDYTDLVVSKKYNGNIAEVIWKTNDVSNDPLKTYGYVYDGLNRLRAGFYQAQGNEIAKEYFEKIDYDINGNIARLKRSEGVNTGNTALLVDNLKYDYKGNRLTKITDEQYNPSGYPTLPNHNNIDYDDNGNMINLKDKGLNSITYNYLNLTKKQTYGYAAYSYTYRADGVKISRSSYYNFTNLTYDVVYLDEFQYNNNDFQGLKLDIVPTSEGFYSFTEKRYIYQYKDHLGNTRVSYARNSAGGIEVTDKNDYYPFGMNHLDSNSGSFFGQGSYKNYKFSGKELQETGAYDFGARMYFPDIVRTPQIDPLAEKMPFISPYAFAFNNPIKFGDPTGMEPEDWVKKGPFGNWEYHSNITSEAQAKAAGYTEYANGRGDDNSRYSTTLGRNGSDIGINQNVVLGEGGNYTVNGEAFKAPDHYTDMSAVDNFGKFMAAFVAFPMLLEASPVLFSTEGLLIKGAVSITGQAAVNKNLDVIDLGADMFTAPGVSGGIGGAYDFNILPDQNGQHFFNNSGDYKKVGVNAATSLISGGLGNRFSPAVNTIQNKATKNAATYMIETNYNIVEQGLNKAYEKK